MFNLIRCYFHQNQEVWNTQGDMGQVEGWIWRQWESKGRQTLDPLKKSLNCLRMKDDENVEYSSKFLEFVNKIRSLDKSVMIKRLAIEESYDLKGLSVAELISKLQTQEQRTIMKDEAVLEEAIQ